MPPNTNQPPTGRKSVLITGCSSGIGHRAAQVLARRGYRVFATARRVADVRRLQAEGLESLQLDLDDSESIAAAAASVMERTDGRLWGLFNNGAYGQPGAVEDLSRETLRAQFETNLFGWLELTNHVIPHMRGQGAGRIVNNSSVLGFIALPFRGAYTASKFALEGLTDTLRLELHGTGIYVSLIEPGPIESRFRANALRHLRARIDMAASPFAAQYRGALRRLERPGRAAPFTLPPEAVVRPLIHALESPRPKRRYRVTLPTHLFAVLRRIAPASVLDRLLLKVAAKENA